LLDNSSQVVVLSIISIGFHLVNMCTPLASNCPCSQLSVLLLRLRPASRSACCGDEVTSLIRRLRDGPTSLNLANGSLHQHFPSLKASSRIRRYPYRCVLEGRKSLTPMNDQTKFPTSLSTNEAGFSSSTFTEGDFWSEPPIVTTASWRSYSSLLDDSLARDRRDIAENTPLKKLPKTVLTTNGRRVGKQHPTSAATISMRVQATT
jgi:hypothetical protein